ncbi:glycosyltransferase [Hyphobacterium sp. HN65]|uniref:Glycosyltransferase n=1 Tax=Hyphobacterium lacteum TaxID=3116575 RepID=A0ABU7LNE1_9PROT|nr:glycosyltransferase [Hyphobacterium sp. HN65]MEE2525443.1 glycosyltransferase [Hyphobacterium sp. HN65]
MRAVERLVPHRLADSFADHAANGLFRQSPEASARAGLTVSQKKLILLAGFMLVATGLIWPAIVWASVQIAAALFFTLLILFRLAAVILPPRLAPSRRLDDADLPVITLLAPVFRETAILDQLMRALGAIDYPPARLDIKIILEEGDAGTIRTARQLAFDSRFELVIVPPGVPQTKPRALNYALRFARGDIISVYDAEDVPHPAQLRAAAEALAAGDERLACVQAPLNWYNDRKSWLTRQFALEYAVQFQAILPLLTRWGMPLPLGGTSNHFRRSALEAAGGWDAYNVTEDADLGFRLARMGYRSEVIAPQTLEEAPETLAPWVKQRSRWLKGFLQTLAVHWRSPARLPVKAHLSLMLTIGAACLSAMLHLPLLLLAALLPLTGIADFHAPAAGLLLCGYAANMLCAGIAIRRAGMRTRLIDILRMPLYWPLQTAAAFKAMAELRTNPYFWAKTEHGFSRAPETECPSPSPSSCRSSPLPPLPSAHGRPATSRIRPKVRA